MPPQCQVTNIRELNGIGADGRVQAFIEVQFRCGAFGPFTEQFPKIGFDHNAVLRKLEEFARSLEQLPIGRT